MAFGWYHEAYIDTNGKLFVCAKAKLSSIEVEGVRDGDRPNMEEITNLPKRTKVRQVSFTQSRMFVLTEKGDVFVYKIKEIYPEKVELFSPRGAGQIRGELMIEDAPMKIKDLSQIKQIACGIDHILFLNKKGEIFGMGDDTFG